ncbi:MAG TPA: zf-HC2 domain-containing protein [Verrucomicrobiae bacterium]|nr:zf-HC2 domain-containing protein [Verrucomicrobiae bacterium]
MRCQAIKEQFDERLDGRLSESQQAAFDAHVAACAECRPEWQAYAGAWEVIGRQPGIEPSFGFVERTVRRLDEQPAVGRSWFWQPAVRWVTLGAAVFALSVVGWVGRARMQERRRAELYAHVQQADYLEDFDVIANLDQIEGGSHL